MAYDLQVAKPFERGVNSFYVSLRGDDPDEISGAWDKLADGAVEVLTPLGPAPWGSPLYGMLTDRFGITWVVDVMVEQRA